MKSITSVGAQTTQPAFHLQFGTTTPANASAHTCQYTVHQELAGIPTLASAPVRQMQQHKPVAATTNGGIQIDVNVNALRQYKSVHLTSFGAMKLVLVGQTHQYLLVQATNITIRLLTNVNAFHQSLIVLTTMFGTMIHVPVSVDLNSFFVLSAKDGIIELANVNAFKR